MHNQVAKVPRNFTQSLETCEQAKPIFVKKTLGASFSPSLPHYDPLALSAVLFLGNFPAQPRLGWVLLLRLGSEWIRTGMAAGWLRFSILVFCKEGLLRNHRRTLCPERPAAPHWLAWQAVFLTPHPLKLPWGAPGCE